MAIGPEADYGDSRDDDYEPRPVRRGPFHEPELHSRLGIASLILAVLSALMIVVTIVVIIASGPRDVRAIQRDSPEAMLGGLLICGGLLASVVGAILGIVGMALPDRKKVCAILGFIFNALIVVFVVGVALLGAIAGKR